MGETELENGRTTGSVKAVIYKYGGKFNQGTSTVKQTQKWPPDPEKSPSKAQELHLAKTRINQINEDMRMSKTVRSQAELQLLKAKKTVKELTSQIEESKSKAKERMKEVRITNKVKRTEEQQTFLAPIDAEDCQYAEVAREVEVVKRELSKIRLDMARVREEKSCAEKEAEAASVRLQSCISTAEQLRKDIEAANEEEVLVELAQIQARKELAVIEAQRQQEAEKFSSLIEETRKKISILSQENEQMKILEDKLANTNSDVEMLQYELKLIKEMDSRVDSSAKLKKSDFQSVTEDLEAAKNELESIKAGGFQLMASMDKIRIKLMSILKEKDQMKELEEKTEKIIQNLNSNLLRATDKLEVVSASEEQAKGMLSNLSLALEKKETEKEAAKKERQLIREETESIKTEIEKTESEIDVTEENILVAMREFAAVKSAEAKALKKLKAIVENTSRARASSSKTKSTITISRFEYDYLTGCADEAQEMAEKKMAAAHAWSEALRASEREMKINIAIAERNIKELKLKEEQEIITLEKSLIAKGIAEGELQNARRQRNKSSEARKSMRENGYNLTPLRRRSLGSPATRRMSSSSSYIMRRRRKVMLKIGKYFANKQIEREKGASSEDKE